jgi:hypothetical protein
MPDIACTQKLAKEFRNLYLPEPFEADRLRGWHANLAYFNRRKCIYITNNATRFTMLFVGLKKPDFMNFHALFIDRFIKELHWLELPESQIAKARLQLGEFRYGKTYDRSVLGSIKQFIFCTEHDLHRFFSHMRFDDEGYHFLSDRMNEMPVQVTSGNDGFYPARRMYDLVNNL